MSRPPPIVVSVLVFVAIALPLAAEAAPFQSALEPAGIQAAHIHELWRLTMAICGIVFVAVVAAVLIALRRAPRADAATPPDLSPLARPEPAARRNIVLALGLSTALLFVLIFADVLTDRALARMPLKDAIHVEIIGHDWWWELRYTGENPSRNFTTANEMHVPVGRPVIATLRSGDVIHSFWVPNLHGKKDLIPGRTALIRFRADQPGTYRGQCAEFCGIEHALMALPVIAEPPDRYDAWADAQRRPAPEPANELQQRGRHVFLQRTCAMCHAIQGTTANAVFGPDLTHLASRQTLAAGSLPNTRGHLAGWILDPQGTKPGANMPASPLEPDEMKALLAYLETLR